MTALKWHDIEDGVQAAQGEYDIYLTANDARNAVLTRWPSDSADQVTVARHAALNVIATGGAFGAVPDTLAVTVSRLQQMAQQYESGLDVDSEPAWRHVPEGS